MPYRPREARDRARMLAATQAIPGAALDRALAQIGAAFGQAAAINEFKMRVGRSLQRGPRHAAVRGRFGARAAMLSGRGLDAATILAERWWRDERKAFQIASALGCGNRLSLAVLSELRLVLRLMRLKRMHAEFGAILAVLREQTMAAAAE